MAMCKDHQKTSQLRFVKRAPMRFGKRSPVPSPTSLELIELLRSVNTPVMFPSFTKKAPMRFGKRAPMRFGKRDSEEPDKVIEGYNEGKVDKRAPIRFGKREFYSDYLHSEK